MFAAPPFLAEFESAPTATIPAAFADADWSLTEDTTAPAQFAPADWTLEDTP